MFCSSLRSRIQLIIILIKTAIGEVIIFLNLAFISLGNDRAPLSGVREREVENCGDNHRGRIEGTTNWANIGHGGRATDRDRQFGCGPWPTQARCA